MECDDFFGDALVHLCEMANQGYFDKKTLNSKADLKALAFTIFRNKVRDARDKETTRVKRMDNEYFENVSEMYWGSFDSEGDDVSKTVEDVVMRRTSMIQKTHQEQREKLMIQAIMGTGGDASTGTYNYFTVWGQTQTTVPVAFASAPAFGFPFLYNCSDIS
jgi:adenylosuccinate synthase